MARFGDPDIARLAQADSGLAHLPAWLIVKGFKPSAIASLDARQVKGTEGPPALAQLPGNPLLHTAQLGAGLRPGSDGALRGGGGDVLCPLYPAVG